MNKIKVLALFGPSGAGKDTIANWIVKNVPGTHMLVSYTTRPKREYEQDGIDYYFITEKEFMEKTMNGLFLETNCFNGWGYATGIDAFEKDKVNIGVFDPKGTQYLIEKLDKDKYDVLPIYIWASDRTRLQRSLSREENPDYSEICRRFLADKEDFKEIPFSHIIYNNDSDKEKYFNIIKLPTIKKFLAGAGIYAVQPSPQGTPIRGRRAKCNMYDDYLDENGLKQIIDSI